LLGLDLDQKLLCKLSCYRILHTRPLSPYILPPDLGRVNTNNSF
jgi:hypothetical protein